MKKVTYFNSNIVRLKETATLMATYNVTNFNSNIVRLKAI